MLLFDDRNSTDEETSSLSYTIELYTQLTTEELLEAMLSSEVDPIPRPPFSMYGESASIHKHHISVIMQRRALVRLPEAF